MTEPTRNEDEDHLRRAIRLAVEGVAADRGGPFGAVVVRGGLVLGEGSNTVLLGPDPTAHAEVTAIRAACRATGEVHLVGATLYTSCEPCPMCLAAAWWARIERIVYAATRRDAARAGFDDEHFYRQLALPAGDREVPSVNLLRSESASPFEAWASKEDRYPY